MSGFSVSLEYAYFQIKAFCLCRLKNVTEASYQVLYTMIDSAAVFHESSCTPDYIYSEPSFNLHVAVAFFFLPNFGNSQIQGSALHYEAAVRLYTFPRYGAME
jgi:hypothetical protein